MHLIKNEKNEDYETAKKKCTDLTLIAGHIRRQPLRTGICAGTPAKAPYYGKRAACRTITAPCMDRRRLEPRRPRIPLARRVLGRAATPQGRMGAGALAPCPPRLGLEARALALSN